MTVAYSKENPVGSRMKMAKAMCSHRISPAARLAQVAPQRGHKPREMKMHEATHDRHFGRNHPGKG